MGLYDRDYFRDESGDNRKRRGLGGFSAVAILLTLNIVLCLLVLVTNGAAAQFLGLTGSTAGDPLQWYRFLTYGFVHSPNNILHLLCNMLVLFFFGINLERLYGKLEFLLFYAFSSLFAGVVWGLLFAGRPILVLGATSPVAALVILFAMNFPHARILLWGIIPMPAWVTGVLFVVFDMYGSLQGGGTTQVLNIVGAVFAAFYFMTKIRFSNLWTRLFNRKKLSRRASVSYERKASSPFSAREDVDFTALEKRVDDILDKISRSGEESLTEQERETLRFASQEYQKRKPKN